jgi:hypothetical protein
MMEADGIYPQGFHPDYENKTPDLQRKAKYLDRRYSKKPIRYYFIDFGLSSWFKEPELATANQTDPQEERLLVSGRKGLDKLVPELIGGEPYNPFPVDVFIIGRVIRRALVEVCSIIPTSALRSLTVCDRNM